VKSKLLKSWGLIWILGSVLFIGGGALNLSQRAYSKLPPTDGVAWVERDGSVYADKVLPGFAASRAGVSVGDRLVGIALDGEKPEELKSAADVQLFLEEAGVSGNLTYLYQRPTYSFANNYYFADLKNIDTLPRWTPSIFFLLLVGLVWLSVGIFVLAKQGSGSPFVIHFATLCLAAFVFHVYRPLGTGEDFDLAVSTIDSLAFIFFSSLFMHFCLRYPVRTEVFDSARWKNLAVYLPAVLLGLVTVAIATYSLFLPRTFTEAVYHFVSRHDVVAKSDSANFFYFVIGIAVGAVILVRRFARQRQALVRQRLKWAMWGTILALVPIVSFQVAKYFVELPDDSWVSAVTTLPLALIPLSFGHSVVRYRLMDVDIVVRRTLVYALTTLAIAAMTGGVALGVIFLAIGENLSAAEVVIRAVIAVIAMSGIILLSEPLKKYLQERSERFFYGERYDLRRGLLDFGRTLSATTALEPLLNALTDRLRQVLDVEKVAVFLEDDSVVEGYRVAKLVGLDSYAISGDFKQMIRTKSEVRGIVRADELDLTDAQDADGRGFAPQQLHYFVPCVVRGRMVAVIGLGRASDGSLLTSEDLDIVRTVAGYVAVAIENSMLYQEQQQRAEELAALKEFNESIVESVNVGLLAVDDRGKITRCNSTFEEMFGISRKETVGRSADEIFDKDFAAQIETILGKSKWHLTEIRHAYKLNAVTSAGKELVLNIAAAPLRSVSNRLTGAIVVLEDVSDRIKLEESLQQSERLSSIGLLAAGIAHEVNTPLTGVSSYTQMLLGMIPESDPKHELLVKVQKQTERASNIAGNLLNFSRAGVVADFVEVDINKLLEDTLQLLEPQLRKGEITVVRDYTDSAPVILGSAGKLQQVLTNLILNARDAMDGSGLITLTTANGTEKVVITVADTGSGIAPENITKIYDPFFTTKAVGSGTGLGLAVSYGIVQEHQGAIEVESEVGNGTVFRLTFPAAAKGTR
jgi:PAS domain S-box-containing protein